MKRVTDLDPDTDRGAAGRSSRLVRTVALGVLYVAGAWLVLLPTLITPVIADDFVNPFSQVRDGGPSFGDAWDFGWTSAWGGGSFRVAGVLTGSLVSWATLWTSATLDVPIGTVWAVVKLGMAIACAASIAWVWRAAARACRARQIGMFESLVFSSSVLFATVQIHADWSNDPVSSYPLVGYGATALGLSFLALVLGVVVSSSPRAILIAAVAGAVAVAYYEMNVGAVVGAGAVLALWMWRSRRDRRAFVHRLLGALAVVLPALIVVLAGRMRETSPAMSGYEGTAVRLNGEALSTFAYGLAGSLPGAAWSHAKQVLGGTLGMVAVAFVVTALLGWMAAGYRWADERHPRRSDASFDRPMAGAVVVALILYWTISILIHAVTVKVQNETLGLGYVYTSYAVGASAVALALAIVIRRLLRSDRRAVLLVVATVAATFVVGQQTVNWRLSDRLGAVYVANRELLDAFDADAPPSERCAALTAWTSLTWPAYYEEGMVGGLDRGFRHYFDEPFCDLP